MTTPSTNHELTREEKLKKRQEQLAAWKQRKEEAESVKTDESASKVDELKKLERQKRLEEWKKRKLGSNSPLPVPAKKAVTLNAKIVPQKTVKTLKKSILESDDEETETTGRPRFVKPSMSIGKKKKEPVRDKEEDEDELDKFLNSLTEAKNKDVIDINESESEDEIDLDAEEQQLLQSKMQKLKEREKLLDSVDHSTVSYIPFRKDFYQPPKEFSLLSDEEVSGLRYSLSEIVVRGENCPIPISKWSQLGLSSPVMKVLEQLNYEKPSPIQSQALPAIMSGRDVIGVAKTGSGKTLSFVLPMLRHVQDQPPLEKGDGPIALILTPTRELAIQIHRELSHFKVLGLSSCCCYGGSAIESQIAELKRGVQIVVGTPGRVIDLLTVNGGRVTNLQRVTYLVLDEADRMFDMGFEPQVTKIFNQVRPDKQTVLFSATFPRKMELLARKGLQNPVEIVVGGISKVASEITQKVELFEADEEPELSRQKFLRLLKILDEFLEQTPDSKVLIFVEKQDSADKLMVQLISSDYPSLSIHGGKEQIDRKHAIKEFSRETGVNVLIATSIAARGLDVKGLDLVINYDAPNHMEDYVHRVGRTGRAGKSGTAVTFVTTKQERAVADLVKAMRLSGQEIEPQLAEIGAKFLHKVRSGKEKYGSGFGGHGLEKLQQVRESTRDLERRSYEDKSGISTSSGSAKTATTASVTPATEAEVELQLPDFTIIEGRAPETSGPDKCKFHSRITINELPQTARWAVVARESLGKIIEASGTSITSKGQYYGPNAKVNSEVPKLYLLVEGLTEASVRLANTMIRQKMIEGLQLASDTDGKGPGKYSV